MACDPCDNSAKRVLQLLNRAARPLFAPGFRLPPGTAQSGPLAGLMIGMRTDRCLNPVAGVTRPSAWIVSSGDDPIELCYADLANVDIDALKLLLTQIFNGGNVFPIQALATDSLTRGEFNRLGNDAQAAPTGTGIIEGRWLVVWDQDTWGRVTGGDPSAVPPVAPIKINWAQIDLTTVSISGDQIIDGSITINDLSPDTVNNIINAVPNISLNSLSYRTPGAYSFPWPNGPNGQPVPAIRVTLWGGGGAAGRCANETPGTNWPFDALVNQSAAGGGAGCVIATILWSAAITGPLALVVGAGGAGGPTIIPSSAPVYTLSAAPFPGENTSVHIPGIGDIVSLGGGGGTNVPGAAGSGYSTPNPTLQVRVYDGQAGDDVTTTAYQLRGTGGAAARAGGPGGNTFQIDGRAPGGGGGIYMVSEAESRHGAGGHGEILVEW